MQFSIINNPSNLMGADLICRLSMHAIYNHRHRLHIRTEKKLNKLIQ